MTLWNKCTKYTNCAVLSRVYKCKKYTIYLKRSFFKNIKTIKKPINRQTEKRVQGARKFVSRYVTRPPPIRLRKEYGTNNHFRRKKISRKKKKFKNVFCELESQEPKTKNRKRKIF